MAKLPLTGLRQVGSLYRQIVAIHGQCEDGDPNQQRIVNGLARLPSVSADGR